MYHFPSNTREKRKSMRYEWHNSPVHNKSYIQIIFKIHTFTCTESNGGLMPHSSIKSCMFWRDKLPQPRRLTPQQHCKSHPQQSTSHLPPRHNCPIKEGLTIKYNRLIHVSPSLPHSDSPLRLSHCPMVHVLVTATIFPYHL